LSRFSPFLFLLYPVVAHLAIVRGSGALVIVSLAVLLVPLIAAALSARNALVAALLVAIIAGLAVLARARATVTALYLPPVVVNLVLAWLFGHTLASGRVPLVERLVRVLHAGEEEIDPAIIRYARRLTLAWTLLLAALGMTNLAIALCVSPSGILRAMGVQPPLTVTQEQWSSIANIGSYGLVGAFLVCEYAYRRMRFPQQPYRNAADFIRRAVAAGPQIMASFRD
jgi:uncharacterized membrane protein